MVVGSRGKALNSFKYSESWLAGRLGVNMAWKGTTRRQGVTLWLNPRVRPRLTLLTLSSTRAVHSLSSSSDSFCPWLIIARISAAEDSDLALLLTSCSVLAIEKKGELQTYGDLVETIDAS